MVLMCDAKLEKRWSFEDYLTRGMKFNLMVGIDFTGSNGAPSNEHSLHYMDPTGKPTVYEKCIRSVADVLMQYDTDKRVPVWGFGAFVGGGVSHQFPLTGNPKNPELKGVSNILKAYRGVMKHIKFSGPTCIAPVLNDAVRIASTPYRKGFQHYNVMLIITDGQNDDLRPAANAIVQGSNYPLSIIIIGVGKGDFAKMEYLDGDKGTLKSSSGKSPARDIVQFVNFEELRKRGLSSSVHVATETLRELPSQVESFMDVANSGKPLPPLPKREATTFDFGWEDEADDEKSGVV